MITLLSEDTIKHIANIFCGDAESYYQYKSGPKLVAFFNENMGYQDAYGQGFPSRWIYVYDKIVDMLRKNRFNDFLDVILGRKYIQKENLCTEVEAAEKSIEIRNKFNEYLDIDRYEIVVHNNKNKLVQIDDDLVLIGSGGFANVYLQKSTNMVVKKLKDDFVTDKAIRSRFKREYNLTKSLQASQGVIQIYDYDDGKCFYRMEKAESTLEKYILNNSLNDKQKLSCLYQILEIMDEIHKKDIIHRDISPNNIFIISGVVKIADFGLGKDLNVFTSHQTLHTNSVGQYYYCAPEQFMMLRDADKRSDVYSLGRIINFVMTGNPTDNHHIYRNVADKATNTDAAYRYGDAGQLYHFFKKAVVYQKNEQNRKNAEEKIKCGIYDDEIENYLLNLGGHEICNKMLSKVPGLTRALLKFMQSSEDNGQYVVQAIDQSFRDVCKGSFEANDIFATFASDVLEGRFSYVINETAAQILRYVAWDVNRFYAQHLVEDLVKSGVEPLIEEIITQ